MLGRMEFTLLMGDFSPSKATAEGLETALQRPENPETSLHAKNH